MTNEWGAPIPGDEMKALKGRIDPETPVTLHGCKWESDEVYSFWGYNYRTDRYHLPANHPYYKVRERNARHGTNLVLHDGSAKMPKDYAGGTVLYKEGDINANSEYFHLNWTEIIAYTPKPKESEVNTKEAEFLNEVVATLKSGSNDLRKEARILKAHRRAFGFTDTSGESEVAEQFPSDEAIEYVLKKCEYEVIRAKHVKEDPIDYRGEILAARLIQQYEPDRLKPAVDVAAEKFAKDKYGYFLLMEGFKAGAAWRKENGNG